MITIREAGDDIRPPCAAGRYSQRTSGRSILADQATGASLRLFSGQRAPAADAALTICLLCSRGGTGRAERLPQGGPREQPAGDPGIAGLRRYLWRSQAAKFWPLLDSPDGLTITVPDAVPVVVVIILLVVHGPVIVPWSPL
jgi:hypothetical protein